VFSTGFKSFTHSNNQSCSEPHCHFSGREYSNLYGAGIDMTTISSQLIIACWLVFIGYWTISARGVKAVAERPTWSSIPRYRIPLLLGVVLLWFPFRYLGLAATLTPHSEQAQAIGVFVCALGLFVAIWSRRTLAGNWSRDVTFKQGHELIQTGPYHFVRHPIYTGILLMSLGTAIVVGRLHSWLGLIFMCAAFWIKLRQEESLMMRHFPNDYPAYRSRVKALVPFII
jgi:protein-S-isoprenylcysteine O-methyltransferase Ste14